MNKKIIKAICFAFIFFTFLRITGADVFAAGNMLIPDLSISIGGTNDPAEVVPALQVLFLISIIALAPSILVLLTGFTRIIIAMHFLRAAMGTQQMPPNQVLIGVALVLTLFLMAPMLTEINDNALQPFGSGEISVEEAIGRAMTPLRKFMIDQVDDKNVEFFADIAGGLSFDSIDELPDYIIIPAFVLGELTQGFLIGFIMYLPFIVIDMVVASVLMAMGMMMLPPAMISLPFKVLLFLLAGGWSFIFEHVMRTFRFT